MKNTSLKLLCLLGAIFGLYSLLIAVVAYTLGMFETLTNGMVALKLVGILTRVAFLFLCAWAAWHQPQNAVWYALGALFAYLITGSADVVQEHGFFGSFNNLIPAYYYTVFAHSLFAATIWLLAPKLHPKSVGG